MRFAVLSCCLMLASSVTAQIVDLPPEGTNVAALTASGSVAAGGTLVITVAAPPGSYVDIVFATEAARVELSGGGVFALDPVH